MAIDPFPQRQQGFQSVMPDQPRQKHRFQRPTRPAGTDFSWAMGPPEGDVAAVGLRRSQPDRERDPAAALGAGLATSARSGLAVVRDVAAKLEIGVPMVR